MKKTLLALFASAAFAGAAYAASDGGSTLDLVSGLSVSAASAGDLATVRADSAKGFSGGHAMPGAQPQLGGGNPPPPPPPAHGDNPAGGHNNPPPPGGGHDQPGNGGHDDHHVDGHNDHHDDHHVDHHDGNHDAQHDANVANAAAGGIYILANLLPLCPDSATTWVCVGAIVALLVVLIIW